MKKKQTASKKIESLKNFNEDQSVINIKDDQNATGILLSRTAVEEMIERANHKTFQRAQEEINKQSQASQASFISVFGIFASIISFLGIEIQFLKTFNKSQEILGFSLIFFAMILCFNIALDYLARSRLDNKNINSILLFGLIIILFIIGLIVFSQHDELSKNKNLMSPRLLSSLFAT